ncbi:MAG TPA: hypothetical protein VFS35_04610, partial [Terrimicrobiaceae bacterium]|nr:hypothetical protein [Terrimicrobiaceae bacterium]
MKFEDPRVTDYALGELQGSAREAFEKELAQSDDLQRELEETVGLCQKLGTLPPMEEGLGEAVREELRAECLRNVRIARRGRVFQRAAIVATLGAAACLLLMPLLRPPQLIQRESKMEQPTKD